MNTAHLEPSFSRLYCVTIKSVPVDRVFLSEWPRSKTEQGEG